MSEPTVKEKLSQWFYDLPYGKTNADRMKFIDDINTDLWREFREVSNRIFLCGVGVGLMIGSLLFAVVSILNGC
jgi:hypothetical protein